MLQAMNAQFDIILAHLAENRQAFSRFSSIAEEFSRAGFQSPSASLLHLTSEGYVEQLYGKDAVYRVTDKGKNFYRTGGFQRSATLRRERRTALLLSILSVVILCLIAFFISGVGAATN
jgi:hypothetical protein